MKIKVLLFGLLADAAKQEVIEIDNVKDTDSLLKKAKEWNAVFKNSGFVISLNKKVVSANTVLSANDEIALLPPFSGG